MRHSRTIIPVSCILLLISRFSFAQYSLDHFLGQAEEHSPALNEYRNLREINRVRGKVDRAQNSAFQVSLTGNYLFTPYFNNHGKLVTTDPSPEAIGYDIAVFNGGLYSAQLNVEHNLFNGRLMGALDDQIRTREENYKYSLALERHNLEREVTEQYLAALGTSRMIQLSRDVAANLEEQLRLTGEMMEKGYVATSDYVLLQIEAKKQDVDLRNTRQQYKSDLLQLYAVCGMEDTAIVDIEPVALSPAAAKETSNFTEKYVLDSLAVAAEQTLFEAKYQPQLRLFVNTGLNAVELQDIERKFGLGAGVDLLLPLFDGRQRTLTREQNRIAQRTISEYRRFSETNIALQRRNVISQLESLQEDIESLAGQIQDYRRLLETSAKQLQQGNMSMIDYLTVLRGFTDLRRNQIETELNYQLAVSNYNYWNW
jgi:outer membrane protein TolC